MFLEVFRLITRDEEVRSSAKGGWYLWSLIILGVLLSITGYWSQGVTVTVTVTTVIVIVTCSINGSCSRDAPRIYLTIPRAVPRQIKTPSFREQVCVCFCFCSCCSDAVATVERGIGSIWSCHETLLALFLFKQTLFYLTHHRIRSNVFLYILENVYCYWRCIRVREQFKFITILNEKARSHGFFLIVIAKKYFVIHKRWAS